MFLKKNNLFKDLPIIIGISIYAYFINWFSGNMGVIPIDSFGFFDTGQSILKGKLPIRDFWIFTGLLVDYMEAVFLFIFGNNWNSHLAHGSFMNIIGTAGLFCFLREINLKKKYVILYSISFATLCYPVSGTPFAYIHAYIFSLLAMFTLIIAIKNKNNFLWFVFPFLCFFSFLSMQTPSAFILIILFFVLISYFLENKKSKNLKIFLIGGITSLIFFLLFFYITKTPIINFIYQYILFPLTLGEARITNDVAAFIGLSEQINFKRIFGEFKFIHILLFPLIFLSIKDFKKNRGIINKINFTIILCSVAFIFNQLITANQIFIFSLIPILAAILHYNIDKLNIDYKIFYLIIFVVIFSTFKFHIRFNIDRKFHDLENVDKSKAIEAIQIHKKFNNLKWISKLDEPNNEVKILKQALKIISEDKREKSLITHYNFISTVLDKDLNILNRWYLVGNNTHPEKNHKYFDFYKAMVNKTIKSNNVKVIYILSQKNEIKFENIKIYFTDVCFESKTIVQKRFSSHKIVNCKS
ncbi:hypothetical protein N9M60_00405 [Candidatus Pelagibacter bacterium]|nr:hypothetical protein [Candidatus Pelagibacter bacterium]